MSGLVRVWTDIGQKKPRPLLARIVNSKSKVYTIQYLSPTEDRIDEIVDYDFVRDTIRRLCETGHINLQETLCDAIARGLLANTQVAAVRVSTCKPDVYPDCDAVGVEVFRLRDAAPLA